MKLCPCGNDEWAPVYDRVPYGNTLVELEADQLCTTCNRSIEEAVEVCTECGHPEEQCTCDIEQSVTTPLETVRDNVQMALDAVANGDFTNARRWLSTVVALVDGADTALIDQLHN